MATIRAYLGTASLTDVGYQFYTQTTPIGSRTETGVTDEGEGYYSVTGVTLQGDHVRWDSTGTSSAKARADVNLSIAAETVQTNLDAAISSRSTVTTAQVNTEVDTALMDYGGPTYDQLLNFVRVMLRSDAAINTDLAAVITAINSDLGSGAGDWANTTEALEAIRDRGDATWTTATGFLDAAGVRTAVGLTSANLDTQFSNIPAGVLDDANGIETGITPRQALRAAIAVLAGQATGGGTTSIVYKNPSGGTTRVTLTVDSNGNRSASTLNL